MTRKVLALALLACAGLAGRSIAAPLPFQGPVYQQNFDQLPWNKDNIAQGGFGSGGTEGWCALSPESMSIVTTTRSRTASSPKYEATVVGHFDTSIIDPPDKAIGRHANNLSRHLLLYLKNETGSTITRVDIAYDVELWIKPTANIKDGLNVFWDIGNYWTNPLEPVAGTYFPSTRQIGRHEFTTASTAGTEYRHSVTLEDINWPVGESFVIKWQFGASAYAANHITAIDNVLIAVPEPGIVLGAITVAMSMLSLRRRSA